LDVRKTESKSTNHVEGGGGEREGQEKREKKEKKEKKERFHFSRNL
jgi:hypothetical protein